MWYSSFFVCCSLAISESIIDYLEYERNNICHIDEIIIII